MSVEHKITDIRQVRLELVARRRMFKEGTGGLFLIRLLRNICKGDSDQALNLWLWRSSPSSEDQILGEEFLLKCSI